MKKPNIIGNILYQVSYELFAMLLPLFTAPFISRMLGADMLGVYSYSRTLATYFGLFGMLGVKNYGNREISVHRDTGDLNIWFWSIYSVQFLASLLMLIVYLGYTFFFVREDQAVTAVQAILIVDSMLDISWFLFGMEQFKKTTTCSMVVKILTTAAVFLMIREPGDLLKYCLIMSGGTFINQFLLWFYARKLVGRPVFDGGRVLAHVKPMLILFIPVVAVSLYTMMLDMHHIRLTYEADLPARSGLGTSSSFAVGMLNAFYALKGQYASKEKLAKEAIYLERVLCAEAGGWQDQIAAAFGGFNRIDFSADGYEVRPVLLSPERKRRLNGRLMMFFTGFTRFSAEIQQLNNSRNGADKLARLQEMLALVDEAEAILTDEQADLNEFGRLLDHTWKLKRGTGAAVSTDCIDALYARGIAAGALGGKLLGAGGGGFLVFYVEPEHQAAVRQAMQELLYIPFRFENGGTRVIYYAPEEEPAL